MTRWFRVHNDLVDHPKVQRLDPTLFRVLINLWCLASANDGVLPPIDAIAFKLRMKPEKVQRALTELRAAGLIDDDERGTRPHNWDERQFTSDLSTSRVKRHRERLKGVPRTASGAAPETEADAEAESKTPSQEGMNSTNGAPARAPLRNGRAV
jgi:DNA-binding transcriptional ArsR family regulator